MRAKAIQAGLKPQKILSVSQWSDTHRVLTRSSSSEAGKWRTDRTPYLRKIMDCLSSDSVYQKVIFMKGSQIGACLPLDTPIPTPTGWSTMGDLKAGDLVFNEVGKPTKVNFKSEKRFSPCWKFHFSDNTTIVSDVEHKWQVVDYKEITRVLKTKDIVRKSIFVGEGNRSRFSINVCEPVEYGPSDLPIDPYLLGVWLGDGNRHTGILYLNKDDSKEILEKINRECRVKDDSENCVEVLIDGFYSQLNKAGLLKNKHVPDVYLRASIEQRVKLLNGLMDTDGSISTGRCEYGTVDPPIRDGMVELLWGLGLKPSVYHGLCKNGFGGKKRKSKNRVIYRVSFTAIGRDIFNLTRKQSKIKTTGRIKETKRRYIKNITFEGEQMVACIGVDSPSHLYLCGKQYLPTHNTEAGNNWIGYTIDHDPAPMLCIQPIDKLIRRFVKQRITPLIEGTPVLKSKFGTLKKDESNTIDYKAFPGGALVISGANSPASLRSMPAEKIFADEIDGYPKDVGGEGDPLSLAGARQRTFARKKTFCVSTPVEENNSLIEDLFLGTDQNFFYVPCPDCNEYQILDFENFKWTPGEPESVRYHCEACDYPIENWQKTEMLGAGQWRPTVEEKINKHVIGFHLNALYSPVGWLSWPEIIKEYETAQASNDDNKQKAFDNTVLGITHKTKAEVPDWQRLWEISRACVYKPNQLPNGVLFLTAGVDIQKDRIECEVVGWGRDKVSWSIDYRVFLGDTSQEAVYKELDDLLDESWGYLHNKNTLKINVLAIDTGYQTQTVYNWCRKHRAGRRVMAVKGQANLRQMLGHPKSVDVKKRGTVVRGGLKLWSVGVSMIKEQLYSWLRQDAPKGNERPPTGFCYFLPYGEGYFQQLTAERIVTKKVKGYAVSEWQLFRSNNEALDVRAYNRAAASLVGMDRFKDTDWQKLEYSVGFDPKVVLRSDDKPVETKQNKEGEPPQPQKQRKKIKVGRSSIL